MERNPFSDGLTMFERVIDMNIAFGNERGDPARIDEQALMMQSKSIGSEFVELMKALGFEVQMRIECVTPEGFKPDMDDVRDALCDIMVFALGAFHRMGVNAEDDMETVVNSVMTRFCINEQWLEETKKVYDAKGVRYTVHGEYPRVFLRSAFDQQMPEYPQGKFLKSASYRPPTLAPLPAPLPPADPGPSEPPASPLPEGRKFFRAPPPGGKSPLQEMAEQREISMKAEREWVAWKVAALEAFKKDLEDCDQSTRDQLMAGVVEIKHVMKFKE